MWMLSIAETLKELRAALLGQRVMACADHMSLVNPTTNHASVRVARWRWLIEEFGPTLECIKGPSNVAAGALSCLDADFASALDQSGKERLAGKCDKVDGDKAPLQSHAHPLSSKLIAECQSKDRLLMQHFKHHPERASQRPLKAGAELALLHQRMCAPKPLRQEVLEWCHEMLSHPGAKCMERAMRQQLSWPGLSKGIEEHAPAHHQRQMTGRSAALKQL